MPDPRLPLHRAAEFVEEPQAGRFQAAHQGNGLALPVHHLLLLARMDPVARRLSRPGGLSQQPAAGMASLTMQFLLYLIVGGLSFCVDIGVFVLLQLGPVPVIPASITSFIAA